MRNEADFTYYIQNRLADVEIFSDTQSSHIVELDGALKTASKNQTGRAGYPDHIALVNDFVLVMEDKSDRLKLVLRNGGEISQTVDATQNYAVNGALFYALKILDGTNYKKIFAFGNVGDRKHHVIQPLFIDADKNITELPPVDTFKNFTAENIDAYYRRMVLKEISPEEKELRQILSYAGKLHEHLRNYGQLGEDEKPLVVSAILLALAERRYGFDLNQLTGDKIKTDGAKIFENVTAHLSRAKVNSDVKKEQVLHQFSLIKDRPLLNTKNITLKKTPLKYFAEFIEKHIFDAVVNNSAEDYLGRFYGEFISYSGGDGQSLGVVLTPRHIAELFCDLVDLKPDDVVFDPCCGTGSFLITAMSRMLQDADDAGRKHIKEKQIHGIEAREDMFSIATTNMILRGDGKSNLLCDNFFAHEEGKLQLLGLTVGFMNPPYSQAKNAATAHLSELRFVLHLLESVTCGGRVAVIVPVSAMIGKTRDDKDVKGIILRGHTLEGVISLNKNTFYRIGVVPCIAVFTAGEPHPATKRVKFINFEDDGYEVKKHVGLVETERAKDRKKFLLECWRGENRNAPSKFMVETTIDAGDEWLHSFYYYNDELPAAADFENTVADYLTFEFNMIAHGRGYLFGDKKKLPLLTKPPPLNEKIWREFFISDLFRLETGKSKGLNHLAEDERGISYLGATNRNNAVLNFVRPVKNLIQRGNCIAFIRNGEGSIGYSVYKREDFIATSDITCGYADFLNEFVGMFITTIADKVRGKYNFNYKRSDTRLRREKLMLPVTDDGTPDFDYMENYIRAVEEKILQRYREFVSKSPPPMKIQSLNEKIWRPFVIGKLFNFETGKCSQANRLKKSNNGIPYIGATNRNNGVLDFVEIDEKFVNRGNAIAFVCDGEGSMGFSFYKAEDCIATTNIIFGYADFLNEFVGMFLTTVADKVRGKYSYNYKRRLFRLLKEKLMLPVTDDGAPDFDYMEAFMKNLVANQYRKYLEYIS